MFNEWNESYFVIWYCVTGPHVLAICTAPAVVVAGCRY